MGTTPVNRLLLLLYSLLIVAEAFGIFSIANDDDYDLIEVDKRPQRFWAVDELGQLIRRKQKKLSAEDSINGHMLKQPLLRFDILWRKFASGRKRFDPETSR